MISKLLVVSAVLVSSISFANEQRYALAVYVSAGGKVERSEDAPSYPAGTVVRLTAVAAGGHRFSRWVVDDDKPIQAEELKLKMNDRHVVRAYFVPVEVDAMSQPCVGDCSAVVRGPAVQGALVDDEAVVVEVSATEPTPTRVETNRDDVIDDEQVGCSAAPASGLFGLLAMAVAMLRRRR